MQFSLTTLSLVLLALVLISAFFSSSEIGMMSLNRYRLRYLVKQNHKQAIRVNQMLTRPDRLLSVILIGNTFANIVASMVATLIGQRLYGDVGVLVATISLTLVILVFSELVPKTIAALHPQQVAFKASLLLKILQGFFAPIIHVISWITNLILKLFGISIEKNQRESLSGEELRSVVHEAGGLLPVEHKSMVLGLLDLEQATVEDIMIPKADIVGIDLEQPWHEILEELETAQHTRLPLYRDTIDNLVGLVHVRSILNLMLEERLDMDNLLKIADAPYFIPEATPLNLQILNFQKMKKRSCFVVDEYGDLLGLVTMEDILEEVVGEFTTDVANLSKDIIQQKDGSVIVDASVTLRQLKRLLGWQLPAIGPRTLSGLIIEYLGYIPPADCCLQIDHFQIEILKVSENIIKTVRMLKVVKKKIIT
ncbi:HlyC/CorC family transporter [Legionella clemsonensis]|uniref:Magnesium and cobalt efflux protein CorC n=1 Tax=Legionella clemsonensis TaxID=1867846 RepID=A0A222P5J7_9GAMM|nr:HlyC/CorC family transporter [Legionella clemsonensis]ASQ47126.1 Magnesium and cobalt efflux protein CorC [Legionella clemsonensis]